MAKAVVFDMGGVMLRLDTAKCIENFKTKAGMYEIEEYLDIYQQKGFIGDLEAGRIDVDEFYAQALSHSKKGTTRKTIRKCFCSLLCGYNKEVFDVIKELDGMGVDLYLLSNNNPISAQVLKEYLAQEGICMDTTFKKKFFSYQMKLLKPGREIYMKTIEGIGREPSDILFIDDSVSNLEAAKAEGITTLLFTQGMNLREELMSLL